MTGQVYTPRPYQRTIMQHLLKHPRCGIWAGMGLGKTVATLTALDLLIRLDVIRCALVIAPLRVAQSTWPQEAEKWAHLQDLTVCPLMGTAAQRQAALQREAAIYTINYDKLPWLVEHFQDKPWPFDTVIADESTRLKGFRLKQGTKRAQARAQVAHTRVERWINLTGTPAPNRIIDLWGQTWFIDRGARLGRTFTAFKERWFECDFNGYATEPKPAAQAEIEAKLRDCCLALDMRDYLDLAQPVLNTIAVELPPAARKLYTSLERQLFAEVNGHAIEAFHAASKSLKCLQLASGAVYTDETGAWEPVHDAKLHALENIIEEASGMPVLVAYHFKSDLARLQKAFPQGRVLDTHPQTIADWNAGKIPVLFAHPASAGHGLNLQDGGNILVFLSHWWDLETYQQIIERIGPARQAQAGHDRPVFVHHIVARGTIDELVMARRQTKREVQDLLLEAMKQRGEAGR